MLPHCPAAAASTRPARPAPSVRSVQRPSPATCQPNNTTIVFLNELGNMVDFFYAGQLSGELRRSAQGAGAVFQDPDKAKVRAAAGPALLHHM